MARLNQADSPGPENEAAVRADGRISITPALSAREAEVRKLILEYDPSGTLQRMLDGVVRVKNDTGNPMRFQQAANTIRGMADFLIDSAVGPQNPTPKINPTELEQLKRAFEQVLMKCRAKIEINEDKAETTRLARSKYLQLERQLVYGAQTKRHQLISLLGTPEDMQILSETLRNKAAEMAKTYQYFAEVLHKNNEFEPYFERNWVIFLNFLILKCSLFFEIAKRIRPFLESGPGTMKNLDELESMLSKPAYFEYFFKKADNPDLFDWLNDKIRVFEDIPRAQPSEDGESVRLPTWWPAKYLIKVADRIPEKVLEALSTVKTDDSVALHDCATSIINMPGDFLIDNIGQIVPILDRWLDSQHLNLVAHKAIDLLKKYLDLDNYHCALQMLDILSKVVRDRTGAIAFRFEAYFFREMAVKSIAKLRSNVPRKLLRLIEKKLKQALKMEKEYVRISHDSSSIWRRAIEDESSELHRDDPRGVLVTVLRDTAVAICNTKPETLEETLARWLNKESPIFERVAIHCARVCLDLASFANGIIMDEKRLFGRRPGYHEFLLLVREGFDQLRHDDKMKFLKHVEIAPTPMHEGWSKEKSDSYRQHEQLRVLLNIEDVVKKCAGTNTEYQHYLHMIDALKEAIHIDDLERDRYAGFQTGPVSPLTGQQVSKMTPADFIQWIKTNLQPPYQLIGPSPEGVSMEFQHIVASDPQPYAEVAQDFLDQEIMPAYLCALVRGLQEATKAGLTFPLEPVLSFIEAPIKFHKEPIVLMRHGEFKTGQYTWLRGAISDLISELVSSDTVSLTEDQIERTQRVLMELVGKDEDPTPESEKEYGPPNMDHVTLCLNSNRGKAMIALMQHALRRARMRPEEQKKKEEGKGPFPPGRRMDSYKDFLASRLEKEASPSVQSVYGQFLQNLFYMDQEWVREMKAQSKLFPQGEHKTRFWEAQWQGYIGFNRLFDQLYELLKDDYRKAIETLAPDDEPPWHQKRYEEALAVHLMIAYWRGLEKVETRGTNLDVFFKKAPPRVRTHAIRFLGNSLEEQKPSMTSDAWKKLKALWKTRTERSTDYELGSFAGWLDNCPENLDDLLKLIRPIIPWLSKNYQEVEFLKYLERKVETAPEDVLLLLNDLLRVKDSVPNISTNTELVRSILKSARKHREVSGVAEAINNAVNRLGELGFYDFEELLVT